MRLINPPELGSYPIIFYDGDCGFCHHSVQWILNRDTKALFRFASLQSEKGQDFLNKIGKTQLDTLYLLLPTGGYLQKSDAILKVLYLLGYPGIGLLQRIPQPIRDGVYDLVARYRKQLMPSECSLPTPEQRKRFL